MIAFLLPSGRMTTSETMSVNEAAENADILGPKTIVFEIGDKLYD